LADAAKIMMNRQDRRRSCSAGRGGGGALGVAHRILAGEGAGDAAQAGERCTEQRLGGRAKTGPSTATPKKMTVAPKPTEAGLLPDLPNSPFEQRRATGAR